MYFKGTSILLKKRCRISAQKLLKKADSSGSLRVLFEDRSTLRRISVASSSGMLRLLFDCASGRSRSVLEALPKPSRRAPEHVSTMSRRSLEAEPKASRRKEKVSPSSDFCLTNFAPTSAFHAIGIEFSSGSHRATAIKTRCRPDENLMKCKNSAGIAQKMVDYSLAQETHRLDYSATLGSPLLSPCYTQGQLNDCTRPTQQKQAFQQVGNARLTYEVESERSVLWFFKSICKALVLRANTLLGSIGLVVQQALKCFLFVPDYKRAHRMVLSYLFLCLVSMFSLSAQTPRKDSGADGLSNLVALKPGDKVPDAVWNQSLELHYFNGKKKTIKFADLKGKLIFLDFWSTGCPSCIEGIPKMEWIQQRFPANIQVIMVNSKRNKDTAKRIKTRFEKFKADFNFTPSLPTVLDDTVFTALFAHNTLPALAVVDTNGVFIAMTSSHSLTDKNIQALVDGNAVLKSEGIYKNLTRSAAEPLLDTVGVHYISAFGGYRDNYLPVYPNLNHKKGTTFLQMGNQSLQFMLFQAYGQVLKGFRQNDLVIDARLGRQFKEKLLNGNSTQNKYWYQFYTDDSVSRSQFADIFCREFQNYFKIAVARKSDSIELYKIRFSDKIKTILTSGKASIARFQGIGEEAFYQNIPIGLFLQNLFYAFDLPTELQEKENFNIDITIPAGFVRWTEQEKLTFLNERGIVFSAVKEYRTYPLVYPIY
ncbi:TlpA family protein disulfide reductase [Sphingobacterium multivorum]|uniref:TlpA family protein disulfide reductase n=1 Tax=Sphingobacterium multivorum TaxID=28454 RepID=UPI00191A05CC|nr:TlpA disulfide reductase family protein [Sphingobacterium multivorum]QQT60322.1 TlpA family protein disulfide reductase [Sphingobacterium multivorum]